MEVVVDTSCLQVSQAGVPRYTRGLLRGLVESAGPADTVHTIEFGIPNLDYAQPKRSLVTAVREGLWGPLVAPIDLKDMGANLLHSPDLPIIRTRRTPHVVTLHDLAILQKPHRYRRWQRWSGTRRISHLQDHDLVVCISEFTANLAMRVLHLDARQIRVIPNGCNYADCPAPKSIRPKGLPENLDYFLFVGSLEPGKNLQMLVKAWKLAKQQGIELPPLVIVGARREGVPREDAHPEDWHYLGHVSDTELAFLYQHARSLLFPSTYEGWGLPIVEAMALGCPVLASPLTAIPEAAGEAALLVAPQPEAWLDGIRYLLRDAVREPLIERGRAHAQQFTWKRMGTELWDAYRAVKRTSRRLKATPPPEATPRPAIV